MRLKVSSSPHLQSELNTPYIMKQVIIALLPVVVAAGYFFGLGALLLILNCVLSSIITEVFILKMRKKSLVINDCSAALTGLLLALTLPPSTSWYAACLGSVVAVGIGKHIFGGLGANIFNPALIGRAFLMAAYPKMLTTFTSPKSMLTLTEAIKVDALSTATPLSLIKFSQETTSVIDLFIGKVSGSLGETSALLLILGGLYLLIRKIADWRIPLSMILTVIFISLIGFTRNPLNGSVLFHLFSGGLLLGALFMATDPVTTPITRKGRFIFGIACGLLIMIIRYFSGLPEGVMYSILFMNAFTPLIDRYTRPARYGT